MKNQFHDAILEKWGYILPDYEHSIVHALKTVNLTEREWKILEMRYGIDLAKCYTLQEIADDIGVTRERIRQIERKIYAKIEKEWWEYLDGLYDIENDQTPITGA